MKNLLSICAGLVVICGIVSANLWRELRAERELTAELRQQLTDAISRVPAPAIPAPLNVSGAAPEAAAPAVVASSASSAPAPLAGAAPGWSGASDNSATMLRNVINQETELWKDPEYRQAQLARARTNLRRQYADLAGELGLSDLEFDQVVDLLAESQLTMSSEITPLVIGAQNNPVGAQEMARRQADILSQRDDRLHALLGSRYSGYEQFQQTLPARTRVTTINGTLTQMGQPLNSTQTRALTASIAAEQQRLQQDRQAMIRDINSQEPQALVRVTQEMQRRNEEANRRILDAAAPVLTAQQLEVVRSDLEGQGTISRASARIRERTRLP